MPPNDPKQRRLPAPPTPKPTSAFGGTLGVMAIALGIGIVGAYTLDLHSHECDGCGHRWFHLGAFNLGDKPAHTCGRCGAEQWWKRGVPPALRYAHDAYLHDSYATPAGAMAMPSYSARYLDEGSPIVSADSMALVPSKDRP